MAPDDILDFGEGWHHHGHCADGPVCHRTTMDGDAAAWRGVVPGHFVVIGYYVVTSDDDAIGGCSGTW